MTLDKVLLIIKSLKICHINELNNLCNKNCISCKIAYDIGSNEDVTKAYDDVIKTYTDIINRQYDI